MSEALSSGRVFRLSERPMRQALDTLEVLGYGPLQPISAIDLIGEKMIKKRWSAIFIAFQRWFIAGMTSGGVKG